MIIIALLILLTIVCTYSWVAYNVGTTVPKVDVTVPSSVKLIPFRIEDLLDSPEAVAEYARQEADER